MFTVKEKKKNRLIKKGETKQIKKVFGHQYGISSKSFLVIFSKSKLAKLACLLAITLKLKH
jgi:hypothetical protein